LWQNRKQRTGFAQGDLGDKWWVEQTFSDLTIEHLLAATIVWKVLRGTISHNDAKRRGTRKQLKAKRKTTVHYRHFTHLAETVL
jgi:hypothetical protein